MLLGTDFCGYFDKLPNPNKYATGSTCLVRTRVLKCSDAKNCNGKWIFHKTSEYNTRIFMHDSEKWLNSGNYDQTI